MITDENNPMIYLTDNEPDVDSLKKAFAACETDNADFMKTCRQSFDDRRNLWPGKSNDLRKHGAAAFPWDGASDQEVNVIGERIDTYVALFMQALNRSHIKAFPTSPASMARANVVSGFLKWMVTSYIPDFKQHMELGANYLLEKGLMITYVGWEKELRKFLQTVTLEQIAQQSPELADMIMKGDMDDDLVTVLKSTFPEITDKRARTAIRALREKGEADIPVPRVIVDRPIVHTCSPDGEIFFPSYVTDPQKSPYVFWVTWLTPQELEKKEATEGWDGDWVDYAIANLKGMDKTPVNAQRLNARQPVATENDLIMVVYGYQRLIDEEDGSEGIYLTVFHPNAPGYAQHELLNGYDEYPLVVTRLSNREKRLYDVMTFSDILRGPQMQIKTEEDARIDRASMATLPPLMHPAGRPPSDWGPGVRVPYRRLGEIAWGPIPPPDNGSVEINITKRLQADRAVGLDMTNPLSTARQTFYVGKFLDHVRDVLSMAWRMFQRMGPDEIFFQVTGNPNPQTMTKGDPNEVYSITVAFDTVANDPETAEAQLKQIVSLVQYDRNGIIDMNKLLEFASMSISPVLADYVLQPAEEAQQKIAKAVMDDLAKIFAGMEVPAQANGAQVALQIVQAYAQQQDISARLQQDEAFAGRLQKYAGQYTFMLQQAQNAQIGKIGTSPADVGGINTQNIQQQ